MLVIDATNAILGRLASYVAKRLLEGEEVVIINAEKAIITGDPQMVTQRYLEKRSRGSPHHGPFYPKRPDLIVRRAIRGMLPRKKAKGIEAFKRLRVYMGKPVNVDESSILKFASMQKPIECKYITIYELSRRLGWVDKRV